MGSLNINGGRYANKSALISEFACQKKIDVLFLQETHTTSADEVDWGLWWKGSCTLSHGTNCSAGAAIHLNSSAVFLSSTEVVKGRMLIIRAEVKSSVFCFVNMYAPNSGRDRVSFFALLEGELSKHQQDQLIVARDFNCTLDFTVDRTGEEPHPQSSQCLNRIITQHNLKDSWRMKNSQSSQTSNSRVTAARLDRIYISSSVSSRLMHSNISPVGFTDHHFISIDLVSSLGVRVNSYCFFLIISSCETAFFVKVLHYFGNIGTWKKTILITVVGGW